MDYPSLAILIAILAYGAMEYRRRERLHRAELAIVRRGEVPPPRMPQHPVRDMLYSGSTLALLLVAAGVLMFRGAGIPRYGSSIVVIGVIFLLLAIPVGSFFARNFRRWNTVRRAGRSRR